MPRLPKTGAEDWDLDDPGTRLVLRPAIAVPIPESEWAEFEARPEASLRHFVGDWLLDEHEHIGRGRAMDGAAGRGADAWIPVLEFVAVHAAGGVIATAAGLAFKRVLERVRESSSNTGQGLGVLVSRGGAAWLAVAEVGTVFDEHAELELEAVDEPSAFAGRELWTLSYVGDEPWVVFLISRPRRARYIVVVSPYGEILGSMRTDLLVDEELPRPRLTE